MVILRAMVPIANQVFVQILKDNGQMIADGQYDAWDPLGAAMIDGVLQRFRRG